MYTRIIKDRWKLLAPSNGHVPPHWLGVQEIALCMQSVFPISTIEKANDALCIPKILFSQQHTYQIKTGIIMLQETVSHVHYSCLLPIEWVSEWFLFNVCWAIFQLYHGKNKLHFDEMMSVMYFFYFITNYYWIFTVLAHWTTVRGRHVALLWHMSTRGLLFQWANTIKIQLSVFNE